MATMNSNFHLLKIIKKENETLKIQDTNPLLKNLQHKYYYEDEDEDEESDQNDNYKDEEDPICGCGKALSSGWSCTLCRHNCTTCQRALTPEEICSRCHVERNTVSLIEKTTI